MVDGIDGPMLEKTLIMILQFAASCSPFHRTYSEDPADVWLLPYASGPPHPLTNLHTVMIK